MSTRRKDAVCHSPRAVTSHTDLTKTVGGRVTDCPPSATGQTGPGEVD